jgi:hypothetical protein
VEDLQGEDGEEGEMGQLARCGWRQVVLGAWRWSVEAKQGTSAARALCRCGWHGAATRQLGAELEAGQ